MYRDFKRADGLVSEAFLLSHERYGIVGVSKLNQSELISIETTSVPTRVTMIEDARVSARGASAGLVQGQVWSRPVC